MTYKRPVATIDAETDPFSKHRSRNNLLPMPFVWGFYDNGFMDESKPFYYFEDTDEFVDFIRTKEYLIYAHNGGKFDYHYLKNYMEEYDEIMVISGRIAKFKIGIAEFRDSWNILPVPLAMYEKQIQDFSIHEPSERRKPENWARILNYLESDCRNLFEIVTAYRERFGSNLTLAGGSMRELDRKNDVPMPTTRYRKFYDDYHPFYFGGRVECFKTGIIERPFKVVDINSAYPFAMLRDHPYSYDVDVVEGDARDNMTRGQIETSFFTIRCQSAGALPWKDPDGKVEDGALIFPNDEIEREYNVSGWELLAGLETDAIKNLVFIRSHIFDQTTNFSEFILTLYEERKRAKAAGDKAGDLLAKLAMNASYGRFAIAPFRFKDYQLFPADKVGWLHPDNEKEWLDVDDRQWLFAGHFGKFILGQSPIPEKRWRFYNVATAASITGFVRAYLWRALCTASDLLYCDTDSIAAGETTVELGSELGQWEIEGEFTKAAIGGKKLYSFKYTDETRPKDRHGNLKAYKVASKGVKLTAMEIESIARGDTVTYVPEVPTYKVGGFADKKTGEKVIARYIPRTITMLERNTKKREV
jgi:hypothetical protein